MGHTFRPDYEAIAKKEAKEEEKRVDAARKEIATKIVMVVVDRIVAEIIRPGPKPEERECYVMAGELRATTPDLEELVRRVIEVNNGVE